MVAGDAVGDEQAADGHAATERVAVGLAALGNAAGAAAGPDNSKRLVAWEIQTARTAEHAVGELCRIAGAGATREDAARPSTLASRLSCSKELARNLRRPRERKINSVEAFFAI